jgi:uncharacterized membrane protein (DUF4010 family)
LKPELRDALLIAAAALLLLPLLPDRPLPWLGGLNVHRVWTLAILILALQGAGQLARRWLGAHRGLVLAGFAGGFASSTATIAAFGARSRQEPAHLDAFAAAGLASTMATFLQFALAADERITDDIAARACLLALSTNTLTRLVLAFTAGGRGFGLRLGAGLLAGLAAAWAVM